MTDDIFPVPSGDDIITVSSQAYEIASNEQQMRFSGGREGEGRTMQRKKQSRRKLKYVRTEKRCAMIAFK
jgi:hypothetical protein